MSIEHIMPKAYNQWLLGLLLPFLAFLHLKKKAICLQIAFLKHSIYHFPFVARFCVFAKKCC